MNFLHFSVAGKSFLSGFGRIYWSMSTGQGSAGNVIAALASFFIPGLGQLIQGVPFVR